MAAKTPDSVVRESLGSKTLFIATFSTNDIDDNDTWATGLSTNIVGYWGVLTDDGTQTKEALDITNASGTLTFRVGEDNRTGLVYVLANA